LPYSGPFLVRNHHVPAGLSHFLGKKFNDLAEILFFLAEKFGIRYWKSVISGAGPRAGLGRAQKLNEAGNNHNRRKRRTG
jgi:hypothetical protein